MYDDDWWVGIVENTNIEGQGNNITFMYPHSLAPFFNWPQLNDKFFIPMNKQLFETFANSQSGCANLLSHENFYFANNIKNLGF